MSIPQTETERLIVRELAMDDLETFHSIMNAGFGESPLDERRMWLEWTVRNYRALESLYQPPYGDYGFALKSTGEMIGGVGLVPCTGPFRVLRSIQAMDGVESRFHQPEFGLFWVTAAEHRGKGYAVEAAQVILNFGFQVMNLRRMVAMTEHDNLASQAVMRKLGMTVEKNPHPDPFWFQTVGVLENPAAKSS